MTNRIVKHTVAGVMALALTAGCLTGTAVTWKSFGMTSLTASANSEKFYLSYWSYRELDDGTLEITAYTGDFSGCSVPSEIGGKTVTHIRANVFNPGSGNLTKITIPATVTSIDEHAFDYCAHLSAVNVDSNNEYYSSIDGVLYDKTQTTLIYCPEASGRSVTLPDTITTICDRAFGSAPVKGVLKIPASVTSIGEHAFYGCGFSSYEVDENNPNYSSADGMLYNKDQTVLIQCPKTKAELSFPQTLTVIGEGAFYNNSKLQNLVIPNGVTSIGDEAFGSASALVSISISESVTEISSTAFSNNQQLGSIEVDSANPVFSSENGALYNKDKTTVIKWTYTQTSAVIPDGVTAIGEHAFELNRKLRNVTIPDSVKSIGDQAFAKCYNLSSVSTISANVENIGYQAFFNCNYLSALNVDSANPNYSSINGVLYNKDQTVLIQCPRQQRSVTIPDTVTEIADYAFYYCSNLTSVVLPDGVTRIGDFGFYYCQKLAEINMPSSLKEIGEYAFFSTVVKEFVFPEGLTKLGRYSLYISSARPAFSLPLSIQEIGERCIKIYDKITYPGSISYWEKVDLAPNNQAINKANLGYRNPSTTVTKGVGSVKLSWWISNDAAEEIGIITYDHGKWCFAAKLPSNTREYTINGLQPGKHYWIGVIAKYNGEWEPQFKRMNLTCLAPDTTVETDGNALRLKWKAVPEAESYRIMCCQGGKWRTLRSELPADTTVFTMKNVPSGTYKAVVLAKTNGEWDLSDLQSRIVEIEIK